MNHASLFSGIGGFDLAAEWMGWTNKLHCEWNPFGQRVLKHYWPNTKSYNDITKSDFTIHRGDIDILTGGFPCQPYSSAGKRLGKEDDRHLWPEMLRAIREIQPTWIVGENVRGLTNWNGGLVFDEVQSEMESEGYEVTPFLLPACAVNAPHRRDRVWFVAYANDFRRNNRSDFWEERPVQDDIRSTTEDKSKREGWICGASDAREDGVFANTSRFGGIQYRKRNPIRNTDEICSNEELRRKQQQAWIERSPDICDWGGWPTQFPLRNGDDGISARLDGIALDDWETESLKAGGNAIVPKMAFQIFKAIQQYEDLLKH